MAALLRRQLRPPATGVVLGIGTMAVLLGTTIALATGVGLALLAAFVLLAVAATAYLGVWTSPTLMFAVAAGATVFSGNDDFGLPLGVDRLLIAAAAGSMIVGLPGYRPDRRIVFRPLHMVLALTIAACTVNAFAAGTLFTSDGLFSLLDKIGIVPMLAFTLAPLLFGTRKSREVLLRVLVVVGAYLGIIGLGEAFGVDALVWPRYILDAGAGLHFGRVRGPFVEAVAMGLGLYFCAVAAAVAAATWTTRRSRTAAVVVVVLDLTATIFTLTRAIWLATVVSTVIALAVTRTTRRFLTPAVGLGVVAIVAAMFLVPGFAGKAEERSSDERPWHDRLVTNAAAVRAIEDHPLFGIGWGRWLDVNTAYIEIGEDYPITPNATNIEIHNVWLSNSAQLGLVITALWAGALLAAVAAALARPGPSDLDPWRIGLIAIAVNFLIVSMFGPLTYAFPNLVLWLWAGVTAVGHTSTAIDDESGPDIDLRTASRDAVAPVTT